MVNSLLPEPSACPAWPSAASVTSRCEPIPAFPLLPGPSTHPAGLSAASTSTRCEPVPAFPLLPEPSACPAWPSAASVASRCEPFPTNRLTPSSRDSGSWPGRDCRREFRQARSRTPPPDSVLAVVGMTDGVWLGGSVMSTLRRGPCRASRHYRGRRNSPCAPPCACCRRRPQPWNIRQRVEQCGWRQVRQVTRQGCPARSIPSQVKRQGKGRVRPGSGRT